MAIQTLVPQYYNIHNSRNVTISSSGTFDNYHHYINDNSNLTYIVGSGGNASATTLLLAFGMGDILLHPESIKLNLTISGDAPLMLNPLLQNNYPLFMNNDNSSIIGSLKTNPYIPISGGRFDTHTYQLGIINSGIHPTDLENVILKLDIGPSGSSNFTTRISKIELVVSGSPVNINHCNLFIPGNVKNRIYETFLDTAESQNIHLTKANFESSIFNRGHYLFDENTGNTVYSSGVTGSGVLKYGNGHWYNFYRNPIGVGNFRQCLDVTHNGINTGNYLDFGTNIPTGDFSLYLRFLPSGSTTPSNITLFSAADFNVDLTTGPECEATLAGNTMNILTFAGNNEWRELFITYKDQLLTAYDLVGDILSQTYVPSRISSTGHIIIGGKTSPSISGGNVPYLVGNPFAVSEFGYAAYGFTQEQVQLFGNSVGYNLLDYLNDDIHPSADTSYVSVKLMSASGEYTSSILISPSSFPHDLNNFSSPYVMAGDTIVDYPIKLILGITSNSTNPSGIFIGGNSTLIGGYKFYEANIPSGYTQQFLTLSGYKITESQSGFYYNDTYDYLDNTNSFETENFSLYVKNPNYNNYSSELKIHSAKLDYDAWFVPETGFNSIPLYISGAPIRTNDIDLYIEGSDNYDHIDLFIKGNEPSNSGTTLFTLSGTEFELSTLFINGMIPVSGNIPLYIAGQIETDNMPLYLHNESFPNSGETSLFIFGSNTTSAFAGVDLSMAGGVYDNMPLFILNEDDVENTGTLPLVMFGKLAGGINTIPMYLANSGGEIEDNITLHIKANRFIDFSGNMPLFINRATSNDANFNTLFIQNNGENLDTTLFINGAFISHSSVTLFMPSSITPEHKSARLYTHGY